MFDFFKPVKQATDTRTYVEIGRLRWEGLPAVLLFWAAFMLPWMLCIFFLAGWLDK